MNRSARVGAASLIVVITLAGPHCASHPTSSMPPRPKAHVIDLSMTGDGQTPPFIAFVDEVPTSVSAGHHDPVTWVNLDTDRVHRLRFTCAAGTVDQVLYPKGSGKPNDFTWNGVSQDDVGKVIQYSCTAHSGEIGSFYVGP